MYIIAGLGNPTSKYDKTRHNVGFDAIDILADRHKIKMDLVKNKALYGTGIISGNKVVLIKPQTYMNLSGEAIAAFVNFYKIDVEDELIVIYDDISLEPGKLRLRKKGSAGGHNGMKDIIAMTGTEVFKRIKIGIGCKPSNWDLADYVLSRFDTKERVLVNEALVKAAEAVEVILEEDFEKAMNKFN